MEKEFVPYQESLELKELGFDEECFAYYLAGAIRFKEYKDSKNKNSAFYNNTVCSMPTFSQAFRWFRDKNLSDACVCRYQSRDDGGIYFYYVINHDYGIEETKHFREGFCSYEEAELACLRKLIEIVKQK